jgi:hypothetical protein
MPNFVVTSLPAYVQENKDMLLKNFALVGDGTRSRISVQTGVKSSAYINFIEVDPTLQDGTGCGFTSQGEVELTQRKIETAAIKVNLEICPKTLRGKYAEYLIRMNATEDSLPFEQYLMDGLINNLNKKTEVLMWQGDTSKTGDANLKWINGFLKIAETETDVVDVTIEGTSVYDDIMKVYVALPDEVIERGGEIYVSPANYRKFLQEMVAKNYFHYASAVEAAPEEFYFPGTNVKVVSTYGLTGVNDAIVGTFAKNLFYGCDMEGDEEDIKVWFSDDDDLYKIKVLWNMGVQIAFPDMVVLGKTA